MKNNMLVLLNRLEDIESHLSELREIAKTHGITNITLARVLTPFGSRIRSRVAPHKLDMAARMSDEAASRYLSKIADTLRGEGVDCDPISTGIPAKRLDDFIKKNNIDLVLTSDGRSGLCRWPSGGLTGRNLQSVYGYGLTEELGAFERRKAKARYRLRIKSGIFLQFGALFLFWLVLSGHFSLKYILFGVASAALVTLLSNDLFSAIFHHEEMEEVSSPPAALKLLRFLAYMPWLLYQIIKANIQIASIVLNPRMPIDPAILQFSTTMKRKVAQVILATSITLTPGTVVVRLEDGRYTIHALVPGSAGDLVEAKMQNRVGAIFTEKAEPPPAVWWAHSLEELRP